MMPTEAWLALAKFPEVCDNNQSQFLWRAKTLERLLPGNIIRTLLCSALALTARICTRKISGLDKHTLSPRHPSSPYTWMKIRQWLIASRVEGPNKHRFWRKTPGNITIKLAALVLEENNLSLKKGFQYEQIHALCPRT